MFMSRINVYSRLGLNFSVARLPIRTCVTGGGLRTSLPKLRLVDQQSNRTFVCISRDSLVVLVRRRVANLIVRNDRMDSLMFTGTSRGFCTNTTNRVSTSAKAVATKKVKLKKNEVFMLFSLARKQKLALAGAIMCLLISSTITMTVPFALGKILDIIFTKTESITDQTRQNLRNFSFLLAGIFVLGGIANFGRVYLFNSISLRIINDLRSKLYRRMLNQECGWFDSRGTGELVNRLSTDTYIVGNSLSQNFSDGLRSGVMIAAGATMMVYTSPQLALASAGILPCVAGLTIVYGRYVRQINMELLDKYAEITKSAEERLGNIHTVKMFCKEEQESQGYREKLIDALQLGYKDVLARASFFGMTGLSGNIIILSVLYYGGILVTQDLLSVGALTSFILYAAYSAISLNGLSTFYTEINKGIGAAQRIWEIMHRKYAIPNDQGDQPMEEPKGEISFQDIEFSFPTRPDTLVLRDINLHLSPGTTTAFVGRSGSGKTTIAKLLLRLYDPQRGSIILDGTPITTLSPMWLRSKIGTVNQEPVLFSGTIRENILYGLNPGDAISEDTFQDIVKKAHVDDFINDLPDGLDTLVGQRGMLLSGGQKQRVAIARALIKDPKILILDEATSALDTVSEERIRKALDNLSKGRTVLVIAHRLSTIRNADNIVVVENGVISEHGRYEDLITKDGGTFKDLVRKQAFDISSHPPYSELEQSS